MVNFIICEDNKNVIGMYKSIISKILMPYDFNYQISCFEKYNVKLKNIIMEPSDLKIYLLDLEMPVKSGIEIAREIRKYDWDSPIIILTSHEELELRLLKEKLLILDFISKFDNYEKRLADTINMILKRERRNNSICIKSNKELVHLKIDNIYYICRDTSENKVIFVTSSGNYPVNMSLKNLNQKLDGNFEQSHKSCIVNKDKIKKIDSKNNIIYFEKNIKTELLSKTYKKKFEEVL